MNIKQRLSVKPKYINYLTFDQAAFKDYLQKKL